MCVWQGIGGCLPYSKIVESGRYYCFFIWDKMWRVLNTERVI